MQDADSTDWIQDGNESRAWHDPICLGVL